MPTQIVITVRSFWKSLYLYLCNIYMHMYLYIYMHIYTWINYGALTVIWDNDSNMGMRPSDHI